ncbi:hypothetical protein B0H13DRAFT_2368687 [Mycena leptocephala]|nr:hypothetical protein B0H13DRAFT_2368687 [Mycena leptocephala]
MEVAESQTPSQKDGRLFKYDPVPPDTVAPAPTPVAAATVPSQDTIVDHTVVPEVPPLQALRPLSDSDDPAAAPSSAAATPAPPAAVTGLHMTAPWVAGAIYGVVPGGPLTIVAENSSSDTWYAITKGRYVSVTNSTAIANGAVTRVSNALRTGYGSQAEAVQAFNAALSMPFLGLIAIV